MHGVVHVAYACGLLSRISGRNSFLGGKNVRPEKFQFLEKWQNRNFGQKFEIYSLDLG